MSISCTKAVTSLGNRSPVCDASKPAMRTGSAKALRGAAGQWGAKNIHARCGNAKTSASGSYMWKRWTRSHTLSAPVRPSPAPFRKEDLNHSASQLGEGEGKEGEDKEGEEGESEEDEATE